MDRPNLDSLTPEQARYIEDLEARVNGASVLLQELNLISNGYAQDLMNIRTGNAGENDKNLNYLKSDKNDATFAKTMVIVDNINKILAIEKATKNTVTKDEPVEQETITTVTEKKKYNIQDFVKKGV